MQDRWRSTPAQAASWASPALHGGRARCAGCTGCWCWGPADCHIRLGPKLSSSHCSRRIDPANVHEPLTALATLGSEATVHTAASKLRHMAPEAVRHAPCTDRINQENQNTQT